MRSRLNNGIKLMAIYVLACTGYIFWNRFFTIPVHLGVDEQLYISMAKSFHYTGHFAENGQILNYSCYFYSILISLAYFFYSPEKIVFLFRCIGVVCMLSSIFPVYLLAKQIFGQSRMIWGITLVSAIIPSMASPNENFYWLNGICFYSIPIIMTIWGSICLVDSYNQRKRLVVPAIVLGILAAGGSLMVAALLNELYLGISLLIIFKHHAAIIVNIIFDGYQNFIGITLIKGALLYGVQLYADFDGYTNIARGCAELLGYHLKRNFNQPYFAVSVQDFWRRWHISLSEWLKEYVYIPLGGSRCSTFRHYINLMLTFLISGLWHVKNQLTSGMPQKPGHMQN